jgi:drug/metabolite transporter (DMT)-like permease
MDAVVLPNEMGNLRLQLCGAVTKQVVFLYTKGEIPMLRQRLADGVLLLITLVWGTTFVLVQDAISTLPPFLFLALRFSLASILLIPFVWMRAGFRPEWELWRQNALPGFILGLFLFLGFAFQTFSLLYTTSGKSGFLTGMSVALVPVFSFLILKKPIHSAAVIGVLLACIGLYTLAFADFSEINRGDVLAFLCAVFFALQIVFTGKYSGGSSLFHLVAVQLLTVAVLSLFSTLLFEPWRSHLRADKLLHPTVVTALGITSVFATVLAFIAQTHVQQFTTPTRVALIFTMEPVFAALADYAFQGVILSGRSFMGCLFILSGMLLSEMDGLFRRLLKKRTKTL